MPATFYSRLGKRLIDCCFAFFGLLALTPLFLILAITLKLASPGPVFFRQTRTGQNAKPFHIIKFRSMKQLDPSTNSPLTATGDPRITPIGAWLRRTKIDELPQLLNVFRGEMSLVGPRPEVPEFTWLYTDRQNQILKVKPGITGPSANVYEEELLASNPDKELFYINTVLPAKLEIDIEYCGSISFRRDMQILAKTFTTIVSKLLSFGKSAPLASQKPSRM